MSKQRNLYDWVAYYEAAYLREKKQNNMLAAKIAEAQAKQEDLNFRLNRIYASPFWRISAPLRKLYRRLRENKKPYVIENGEEAASLHSGYYEMELQRQRHPYQQWLKENEEEKKGKKAGRTSENNNNISDSYIITEDIKERFQNGMWKTLIPETDIILFGYGDGALNIGGFEEVKSWFSINGAHVMSYADEDYYWEGLHQRMQPWFKPCYSPDTLLSFNYFGHMVAVKNECAQKVWIDMSLPAESCFYDLCLKLEEQVCGQDMVLRGRCDGRIGHIGSVLFHNRYYLSEEKEKELIECSSAEERFLFAESCLIKELEQGKYLVGAGKAFNRVKEAALVRRGIRGRLVPGRDEDVYHVLYEIVVSGRDRLQRAQHSFNAVNPQLLVSVVIPSKDNPEVLEKCLTSFVLRTEYENYEFIIVDNGSREENAKKVRDELPKKLRKKCVQAGRPEDFRFLYLYEPMSFNFSKMCNLGVEHADGDLILLMNDDIEVIEKDWLLRMAGQASRPSTGAVGAKLWYADSEKIQHAGITNLKIGPSHKLVTFLDDRDYYYGRNRVTYDMIGVTAACLLVAKKKYEEVGGLDESMAVSYNDVDFCFKLHEAGYYNVLRNDAVLYHHESLSRGLDEQSEGKWDRLLVEKEWLYEKHPQMNGEDDFYSAALIDNASHYGCNYKFPYERHLYTEMPKMLRPPLLEGAVENLLQLTIDRAEIQQKLHREEPDILWIMGWCYLAGADNGRFDKTVILKHEDGTGYAAVPADWHRTDVEAILPHEKNIGLAGFVLRIEKKSLKNGTYRIGLLYKDDAHGLKMLAWSDKTAAVD